MRNPRTNGRLPRNPPMKYGPPRHFGWAQSRMWEGNTVWASLDSHQRSTPNPGHADSVEPDRLGIVDSCVAIGCISRQSSKCSFGASRDPFPSHLSGASVAYMVPHGESHWGAVCLSWAGPV